MTEAYPIEDVISRFTDLEPCDDQTFDAYAAAVLAHQRTNCQTYGRFEGFKYLPVQAFKLADVTTFPPESAERVFRSSGTAGQSRSRHFIADSSVYERSVLSGFDGAIAARFGWDPGGVRILGHLPAYARESSLVAMLNILIRDRGDAESAFFLEDRQPLEAAVASGQDTPVLLFGAAFGLLDLIEGDRWEMPPGSVVVETGGMKTHRREIGRTDLHDRLASGFGVDRDSVVSEYGMCELMSQCYTDINGIFRTPPWMRFEIIDPSDGQTPLSEGEEGALAILDLANVHTVSAILTEDRATAVDGGFLVHGRLSEAELRGCNFLLES